MGGRGVYAGDYNSQISMSEFIQRGEIINIKTTWEAYREEGEGGFSGRYSQSMLKKCACCMQYTLPAFSDYEKCPVCGWIDDPLQNQDINSVVGSNSISLHEARLRWKELQVSAESSI